MHKPTDPADPLAVELADMPEVITRLLGEHTDDRTGHCRLCSAGPQSGRKTWPCRLWSVAEAARKVREGVGTVAVEEVGP